MAVVKSKRKSVIQAGTSFSYNPETFLADHKVANFFTIEDPQEILRRIKPLEMFGRKFISFDTETFSTGLKSNMLPFNVVRRWVGSGKKASPQDFPFCFSISDGTNCYSIYDTLENKFAKFKALAPLFEDPTIDKIAHNAKFDMHMFANIGMKIVGKIHDTVVLAKLANENRFSFKLRDMAKKLEHGIDKFEYMVDGFKKTYKIADYRMIPKELLSEYANADVWNCINLFISEYPIIIRDELESIYNNECELMMCLWMAERWGMKADATYESSLKEELQVLTDTAEAAIYDEAGEIFNINSGAQIYKVLMKLGVSPDLVAKSDKGNPVLDKDALQKLADVHNVSIVTKILTFRKYEKLLGTYAVGIYDQMDSLGGVHGSVNQTEATTGRMSITKPALQTLPKKDKRIRRIFIPREEYELWFMDLDQVEYRGFAHYAQAKDLIQSIKNGLDIHTSTAALMFNVPYNEVTDDMRSTAKTMNFASIYGMGVDSMADSLKCTLSEAYKFKDRYFANLPEAAPFINTVQKVVRARGYVKNFYGRRRRLTYNEAYKAVNALIQGWAADYIKHQMVKAFKFLLAYKYKTRMINVVHDEVIFENHATEKHILAKLRWLLSDFDTYRVPITAGIEKGNPSWGEKIEPDDLGFEALTEEEMSVVKNCNVFDGSVFDMFIAA